MDGGRTLATWGMGMSLLVAAVAFSTLLLTYFYLRIENPSWPPEGVADPALGPAAIAAVAVCVSALSVRRAHRGISGGSTATLRNGLVGAGVLTVVAGALLIYDLTTLDFRAQDHAYGSIFYLLAGFLLALALIGLVILSVVLGGVAKGQFSPRRHAAVTNTARYWSAFTAMWLIGSATLYLVPRLVPSEGCPGERASLERANHRSQVHRRWSSPAPARLTVGRAAGRAGGRHDVLLGRLPAGRGELLG